MDESNRHQQQQTQQVQQQFIRSQDSSQGSVGAVQNIGGTVHESGISERRGSSPSSPEIHRNEAVEVVDLLEELLRKVEVGNSDHRQQTDASSKIANTQAEPLPLEPSKTGREPDKSNTASSSISIANELREEKRNEKILRKGTAFLLQMMREENQRDAQKSVPKGQGTPKSDSSNSNLTGNEERSSRAYENTRRDDISLTTKHRARPNDAEDVVVAVKRSKLSLDFEKMTLLQRESAVFNDTKYKQTFGFSFPGNICNNYVRCCKWSASGEYLLTSSQDRLVRVFQLNDTQKQVTLRKSIPLGDLIYDCCWHPSRDLLATSSKDHPIHLWSTDGELVKALHGINHLDELSSAYSMCFSLDGRLLYGGYNRMIRIFDLHAGGRRQIRELHTWKKNVGGQRGIVSCIAMNPSFSGLYAVASYGRTLAIYSDLTAAAVCSFETPWQGTTFIRYSSDGNFLFTAARKNDLITCWDLRFPGQAVGCARRPSSTNQTIYFELDSSDEFLLSGSSSGEIHVFDLKQLHNAGKSISNSVADQPEPIDASHRIKSHRSTLAGISLHPNGRLLATCSGQRVFPMPMTEGNENDDEDDENGGSNNLSKTVDNERVSSVEERFNYETVNCSDQLDNSLCLWSS
ncbi:unnamed protein product [Anisakis simplex]|uniref:WD repeat-containing protein 79 n=1 Tax=Anisakis simplex TaxID=6269 RepID=A0A0M3K4W3_ANISI|nr:unnamed protein product [Anisakis simplex]